MVLYCRVKPEDVHVLFDMLTIFTHRTVVDFSFLKDFFRNEVAAGYIAAHRKAILQHFLKMLTDQTVLHDLKVEALQLLVLPLLASTFEDPKVNNGDVVDGEIIATIMRDVLGASDAVPTYSDALRIQLLQLATLLIQYLGKELLDHRKELIKFAWNHLKSEDTTSKQWAYVNVCRFIDVYETPPKIILQVYVALLRTYQPEARKLVRTALEILTPALPKRLPESDFNKAIKWTKKIVFEEGHALPQLVHIWQLLVSPPHPNLFYSARYVFVPQIVNSLNRLALPPNCPLENRQLAVALAELIIAWDLKCRRLMRDDGKQSSAEGTTPAPPGQVKVEEAVKVEKDNDGPPAKKQKQNDSPLSASFTGESRPVPSSDSAGAGVSAVATTPSANAPATSSSTPGGESDFQLNLMMVDMVTNFLVRMALTSEPKDSSTVLSKRCISLIKTILRSWPQVKLKFSYFEKLVVPPVVQSATSTANFGSSGTMSVCLTLLLATLKEPTGNEGTFILENIAAIQKLIAPAFGAGSPEIKEQLGELLLELLRRYPPKKDSQQELQASNFYEWLKIVVSQQLKGALNEKSAPPTVNDAAKGARGRANAAVAAKKVPAKPKDGISALGVVQMVQAICSQCPKYLDHHACALLKLAQRLCRDHIQAAVAAQQHVTNARQQYEQRFPPGQDDVRKHRVMATPSIAVLNSVMGKADPEFAPNATPPQTLSESVDDSVQTLILCIELLGDHIASFAEYRKAFLQVLTLSLDKSDSMPLLVSITKLVGKWVTSAEGSAPEGGMVLTTKEKQVFLQKMSHFDRLEEVEAQPLINHHLQSMLQLHSSAKDAPTSILLSSPAQQESYRPFMMAGLLSPDPVLRQQFFEHFFSSELVSVKKGPFALLQFLLKQNWKSLERRYWIVICLDVMLSALYPSLPLELVSGTAGVLRMNTSSSKDAAAANKEAVGIEGWNILEKHDKWLESLRSRTVGDLVTPLRHLVHADVELGQHLWPTIFPIAWSMLSEAQQCALVNPLVNLLSKGYHARQLLLPPSCSVRCNVVESLLRGLLASQPVPNVSPELLAYLSKAYNTWHLVIPTAEHQVLSHQTPREDVEKWLMVLADLYEQLSEHDVRRGLHLRYVLRAETKAAIAFEIHGKIKEAQQIHFNAITRAHSGQIPRDKLCNFEMALWEGRWVNCARQLGQWPLLSEFARAVNHPDMILECAWKLADWNSANDMKNAPSVIAACESGDPATKIRQIYVALEKTKMQEVDALCKDCIQMCLHKWRSFPVLGAEAQMPLLQLFHQLVELQESAAMVAEIQRDSRAHQLPDFKPLLSTWRERLPNKWDNISVWDNILVWRNHMFSTICEQFQWAEPQQLACMHDTPWTVIKLAHTARKQSLGDVCLNALSKLSSVSTMDVQDVFEKLREQIIICYESPSEQRNGLSMINNTNLDYFSPHQKAELFTLKAQFLRGLAPASGEINRCFSHALAICDSYGQGWADWAEYCDSQFDQKPTELHYAVQAMACYLQAVYHKGSSSKLMLARVLWLLSLDDQQGTLADAFETHSKHLPPWIWLVWIPQLLTSLARPEARVLVPREREPPKSNTPNPMYPGLMRTLAAKYPQALYYTMRAFLLEKREVPSEKIAAMTPTAGFIASLQSPKPEQLPHGPIPDDLPGQSSQSETASPTLVGIL
jgi:transformation/transcription domain-associated protein